MTERILRGRLAPEEWYPAGAPGIASRLVALRSGLRARVIEQGPPDGEPVLLLHGWGCSVYLFRRNIGALAAAGHRVLALDLQGHGQSDKPGGTSEYTPQSMRAFVLDVLDALQLPAVSLVAHSMAGALATSLALHAPARVARLGLLAPIGFGRAPLARLGRIFTPSPTRAILPHLLPRWAIRMTLRLAYGAHPSFTSRDVDEYWAPSCHPEFTRAMRDLLHAFDWSLRAEGELAAIEVPAIVMFGALDRFVRGGDAERLARALPRGRFQMIDGAGHILPEDAPGVVNAALLGLLAEPSP